MKKILVVLGVMLVLGIGTSAYFYNKFYLPNVIVEDVENSYIYIKNNANYEDVLDSVKVFLKDEASFKQLAEIKKYPSYFRAGRYKIENNWSNNELINHLRSGKQAEIKLVFNNAGSVEELAGKISRQIEADSASIINYVTDANFLKENKFTKESLPSLFVPNTYFFYWNTNAENFSKRMLKEYNSFWNKNRLAKANKLGLSPNEVGTLASIVQKETVKREERKVVAGLYINRLNNNWKLESDPTVIFALRKKAGFKIIIRRVLFNDLKIDSPYNTYKYSGLPPGPITIPEIDAIDAVLNYKKHSYFFMCASVTNQGYHEFAKSLRQHNVYARKYRNWLNKQNITR